MISMNLQLFSCSGCSSSCFGCGSACVKECDGGCTGMCHVGCSGGCKNTCNDGCNDTCKGDCTNSCGGSCGDACSFGCSDSCSFDCSGGCKNGCGGCGGCSGCSGCGGACSSSCSGSCDSTCNDTCKGDCNNACKSTESSEVIANLANNIKKGNPIRLKDFSDFKNAIQSEITRRGKTPIKQNSSQNITDYAKNIFNNIKLVDVTKFKSISKGDIIKADTYAEARTYVQTLMLQNLK